MQHLYKGSLPVYLTIWVTVKNSSCPPTVGRLLANCWPTVDRLSVHSRPTVGQELADCWPTVDRLSAHSRPTNSQQFWSKLLADSQPFVGLICRPTVITSLTSTKLSAKGIINNLLSYYLKFSRNSEGLNT